jgi:hypothetical protein
MSEENLFNLLVFHIPEHVSVEGVSGEIQFHSRSKLQGKSTGVLCGCQGVF